ncbi:hypothetical protein Ctaglu_17240 [Clostridium tagluense]|uniref:Uncharacterized protein n=1 Tax=Clostridium tagluense TaxID=360422 RepID=A0A401UKL9_9CLOT|nr:hypothetical protein Ctaglu_17240 [Clostridium tagluense]
MLESHLFFLEIEQDSCLSFCIKNSKSRICIKSVKFTIWRCVDLKANVAIGEFEILFERLDKKLIDEELNRLKKSLK